MATSLPQSTQTALFLERLSGVSLKKHQTKVIEHQHDHVGNLIHTETNLGSWIDSDYDDNGALRRLTFESQKQFYWVSHALCQEIERTCN
ncbi:MAG: hypothetical protein DRR16_26100 [Candidatus Parabeggiatoa sp. nov. 3]|nr:MAG: hypothetical protein DRR00_29205 [Gammaproteobacteria bacterium]RKZ57152.1 MAG: hypothetical protein DRQ99_27385 [Gammaproteobacteria bacterium]RKZ79237.1 MAG: hypothetical protein DRR16_26100 [Gammaproteobacteria bacterium]